MQHIEPLSLAYAEIFLLVMACVILIADLFVRDEKRGVSYFLTQLTLAGCALLIWFNQNEQPAHTFSGMFVGDLMSDVLKLVTCFGVMAILIYARDYVTLRGMFRGEFFTLTLFATLGLMVMISANHLLTLYLGLELLSLSLYALVALQRDSAIATEAAMKYFVLGALASGMLLYGMSMVYGATGTLEITRITAMIADDSAKNMVLVFGLVFLVAGIGFKLGAAPFHMWLPDVYHGAPTAVTTFIGSVPKLAAFAFVIRLLVQGLGAEEIQDHWQQMLAVMAVLSLIIGNVTAIAQTNLKRMLAYSTISHMGFLLLAILAGGLNGYAAGMFYTVVYVIMSLGAFGMIMLLSRAGFEAENLEDFKGLNQRSPWHAFLMLLLMFSMAGVPPTVGFYAKFSVLRSIIEVGHVWLAVFAVVFSLIGAFYYLRIVKLMYFDEPVEQANNVANALAAPNAPISPRVDANILLSVNGLAVLVFGIFPQPLMALCAGAILASL